MKYIRFKVALEEATFNQKLAILANSLIMSLRSGHTSEPGKTTPNWTLNQAAGQHGKTDYRRNFDSPDVEDKRKDSPDVLSDLKYSNIIYPEYSKEESNMIFWYNELVKTLKTSDHSSVDWNFLYALRNSAKTGNFREFYDLMASKAKDIGGNIAAMEW